MKIAWDRDEMKMRSLRRKQETHIKRTGHLHEKIIGSTWREYKF